MMTLQALIEKVYTTLLITIFFLVFSIVTIKFFIPKTIWMVANFPYPTEYYSPKKILIVAGATLILFLIFLLYYKLVISKINHSLTLIVSSVFLLLIIASEIIITSIAFNPVIGDYAVVKTGINAFYEGKKTFPDMHQFQMYPYNTHILLLGGFLAKLFKSVTLAVQGLPIVCITGSIAINALILKKVTNFKAAHISIVLAFLNIFIYWQAPVFYTHTIVIFFLSAALYSYLSLKTAQTKRKKLVWWVVFGFFAACTYMIRPTALSVVLAILFENVFKFRKAHSAKLLSSVFLCILLIFSCNSMMKKLHLSTDNNIDKMPFSHWVKMGLNQHTYGVWNVPDVTYPDSLKNTLEKDTYNKKIIIQRLKDFGPVGYIKHLNEKVEREWVSSQFSSYRIGEWFQQKNHAVTNIVSNYSTRSNKIFDLYSFIIKLFLLIGTLLAVLFYRKLNEDDAEVLRISMTSTLIVFVFLLMWETAPHYSYEAYAFMNIPASLGFCKLFSIFEKK